MNQIILEQQYFDLFSSCRLLGQIYTTLENLGIFYSVNRKLKDEFIYQIKCSQSIQKAILEGFIHIILIGTVQPIILEVNSKSSEPKLEEIRTTF